MVTGTKLSKDLPRTAKDSTHFAMHAPPTPSEFDETTSLLPCQCFYKFLTQVPSLSNFIPCIFSSPKLLNMRFLRTRRHTRINSTRVGASRCRLGKVTMTTLTSKSSTTWRFYNCLKPSLLEMIIQPKKQHTTIQESNDIQNSKHTTKA